MKKKEFHIVWVESFKDLVQIARQIFHFRLKGKDYYYCYLAKTSEWTAFIAFQGPKIKEEYACVDSSGNLTLSDTPDDPTFKPIIKVKSDPLFEKALK